MRKTVGPALVGVALATLAGCSGGEAPSDSPAASAPYAITGPNQVVAEVPGMT